MKCRSCRNMGYAVCEGCPEELIGVVERRFRAQKRQKRRESVRNTSKQQKLCI